MAFDVIYESIISKLKKKLVGEVSHQQPGGKYLELNGAILQQSSYPALYTKLQEQPQFPKMNPMQGSASTVGFTPTCVATNGSVWVSANTSQSVRSTNGTTWSTTNAPGFIALATDGTNIVGLTSTHAYKSTDGANWSNTTLPITLMVTSGNSQMDWDGTYFVFTGRGVTLRSTDGQTFTINANICPKINGTEIARKGTTFLVYTPSWTASTSPLSVSTDNGATWATPTMPSKKWLKFVGNGTVWFGLTDTEVYVSSSPGSSWSAVTLPAEATAGGSLGDSTHPPILIARNNSGLLVTRKNGAWFSNSDGTAWTVAGVPSPYMFNSRMIATDGWNHVGVMSSGMDGTTGDKNLTACFLLSNDNCANFKIRSFPTHGNWGPPMRTGSYFVIPSQNNTDLLYGDGDGTWTLVTSGLSRVWSQKYAHNGAGTVIAIAITTSGAMSYAISTDDGISWTAGTTGSGGASDIIYHGTLGRFLILPYSSGSNIRYSDDGGSTWVAGASVQPGGAHFSLQGPDGTGDLNVFTKVTNTYYYTTGPGNGGQTASMGVYQTSFGTEAPTTSFSWLGYLDGTGKTWCLAFQSDGTVDAWNCDSFGTWSSITTSVSNHADCPVLSYPSTPQGTTNARGVQYVRASGGPHLFVVEVSPTVHLIYSTGAYDGANWTIYHSLNAGATPDGLTTSGVAGMFASIFDDGEIGFFYGNKFAQHDTGSNKFGDSYNMSSDITTYLSKTFNWKQYTYSVTQNWSEIYVQDPEHGRLLVSGNWGFGWDTKDLVAAGVPTITTSPQLITTVHRRFYVGASDGKLYYSDSSMNSWSEFVAHKLPTGHYGKYIMTKWDDWSLITIPSTTTSNAEAAPFYWSDDQGDNWKSNSPFGYSDTTYTAGALIRIHVADTSLMLAFATVANCQYYAESTDGGNIWYYKNMIDPNCTITQCVYHPVLEKFLVTTNTNKVFLSSNRNRDSWLNVTANLVTSGTIGVLGIFEGSFVIFINGSINVGISADGITWSSKQMSSTSTVRTDYAVAADGIHAIVTGTDTEYIIKAFDGNTHFQLPIFAATSGTPWCIRALP